jgi:hypothetical protein
MIELAQNLDLAPEALFADHGRDLWPENLDCDLALRFEIVGEHHVGRGAASDYGAKRVSSRQPRSELRRPIRHRSAVSSAEI